ncbi:hypothetical protein C8Q75DRAFT_758101 [Abortiporus biennis]|nr:hypothetical protein C8Q75DRAFT_758101 [Abortiporus biennis]
MSKFKDAYETQGYVLIPSCISDIDSLRAASERVITKTRSGQWPYRRTVGRQFPPFGEDESDSWGVQHVMHPDLEEPIFSQWYTSDHLTDVVKDLLECEESELQMELFNMLINPESHDFALRWHRDDIRENASEQEERTALDVWHHGVQWNTALYEDACLYVVPGSHKVSRTPEQRNHSSTMEAPKNPLDMPGSIQVVLKTGETVFYNSNILHCATYSPLAKRATLHASMGSIRGGSSRARNVLQHGLNWMTEPRFGAGLNERGRGMLARLVKMKEGTGDVGYSLDG